MKKKRCYMAAGAAGTCGPDTALKKKAKTQAVPSGSWHIPVQSRKGQKLTQNRGYYDYDSLANAVMGGS